MTSLDWIAAAAAFVLLGIPFYWFTLHPFAKFWRGQRAGIALGIASAMGWLVSGSIVVGLGPRLFAAAQAPRWAQGCGLLLLALEAVMLRQVFRVLGPERVIGKVELGGAGQLHQGGLYAHVRHPSYAGMMGAMLGVCLLAGTLTLWAVTAAWLMLMRTMVFLEERELLARFGPAYAEYRKRVPAFLPFRFFPGE